MNPYRKNDYKGPSLKFPESVIVQPKWLRTQVRNVSLGILGLVALAMTFSFCTPAEQNASAKLVADVAQCIESKTSTAGPGADPGAVALACGIEATPDIVAVIVSVIDAKKNQAAKRSECVTVRLVDAGAMPETGGK